MESILSASYFHSEAAAYQFIEARLWPHGPVCPKCGVIGNSVKLQGKSTRLGVYKCRDCRKPFRVTVGTIFEASHIPLNVWLQAVYLVASSKKGISSNQIHRALGVTLKSAWFMSHRIREAMRGGDLTPFGADGGIVEIDETYIGGKPRHMASGEVRALRKMPVVALVERNGAARAWSVRRVTGKNVRRHILKNIDAEARVMTDEANLYKSLDEHFASHESVNHSRKEWARGDVTSNTVESFFALLKRGMYGTFHSVSEQHLHRYVDEFAFRWSHRMVDDGARTLAAMKGSEGKRLTYRDTSGGAA